jgi:CRISPR-associated protein Csb1
LPDIGAVTTLDAPHRIFDAILRDSVVTVNGRDQPRTVPFRSQLKAGGAKDTSEISPEGAAISQANVRNATPLFELCPTALIFGAWDSTGAAGGLGNKFARALVSEIIGIGAVYGVRTASRIDPLGITGGKIFADANGDWTPNEDNAQKVKVKKDKETPGCQKLLGARTPGCQELLGARNYLRTPGCQELFTELLGARNSWVPDSWVPGTIYGRGYPWNPPG